MAARQKQRLPETATRDGETIGAARDVLDRVIEVLDRSSDWLSRREARAARDQADVDRERDRP
jgi:hypothetical protein